MISRSDNKTLQGNPRLTWLTGRKHFHLSDDRDHVTDLLTVDGKLTGSRLADDTRNKRPIWRMRWPWSPDVRVETKLGQIGLKLDKSGTFSDQISVHFGAGCQNVLKSDLKKSRICPIWGHFDQFWAQISLTWQQT